MNAKQLETVLAHLLGWKPSEIDKRTRYLRGIGNFPKARGKAAPDLDAYDAGFMLNSLVSRRATDAQQVAGEILKLRAVASPYPLNAGAQRLLEMEEFGPVMPWVILDYVDARYVSRVQICQTGKLARVIFNDRTSLLYTSEEHIRRWAVTKPHEYAVVEMYLASCKLDVTAVALRLLGAALRCPSGEAAKVTLADLFAMAFKMEEPDAPAPFKDVTS